MKRYWLPLTVVIITVGYLLFRTGFFTGREHKQWQHPYSRVTYIEGGKPGEYINREPNVMTEFYHKELGQPLSEAEEQKALIPSESTYSIPGGGTDPQFEKNLTVAPVTFLAPQIEVAFLKTYREHLLNQSGGDEKKANAACLNLIHSLYTPMPQRKTDDDKAPPALIKNLIDKEKERVRIIAAWNEVRQNTGFRSWWTADRARIFGLSANGQPL